MRTKGAGERYDVGVDWTAALADVSGSETISDSQWAVVSGDVTINNTTGTVGNLPAKSSTNTATKVWWNGGTDATTAVIKNTITTNNSRVFEEFITVKVTR